MKYRLFSKLLYCVVMCVVLAMPCVAMTADDDTEIRLNPELGTSNVLTVDKSKRYPYIRYDLNTIDMNGDDWSELAAMLDQARQDATFTVVHIGDSHIQADGNTGTTRKLFQNEYGDAGRGVVIPFKLAGTNQPLDYKVTSTSPMVKATLMRQPWPTRMGFTGVSLHPENYKFSVTLSVKSPCGYLTVLGDGDINVANVTSGGREVPFATERTEAGVDVMLDEDCLEITLDMEGSDVNIYGFDLRNDSPGVLYHAIGNNGAAYSSYNALTGFGKSVANLTPDLVIVSLGTNEAFGKVNDESFNAQMTTLVRQIRQASPQAKILLVTPSECQKSVYTTTRTGKGRNRRTTRRRTYQVNTNVAKVRNLIVEFGKQHNIPVYDFYAVAGGQGASAKWLADKLLSADRIHRTWAGYRLDGELMYEALRKALSKQ